MPDYNVTNRAAWQQWHLAVGPVGWPGPPMDRVQLFNPGPNIHMVAMGAQANVALNPGVTGIYTQHLTDCSAFCLLYHSPANGWSRASLIHMMGGPNPNSVNWAAMANNMPMGGGAQLYGVLANSSETVLTGGFLAAVGGNLPMLPAANMWVYNGSMTANRVMAINFGVDWGGFAGE
jgi:hypothetical protein